MSTGVTKAVMEWQLAWGAVRGTMGPLEKKTASEQVGNAGKAVQRWCRPLQCQQ